MAMMIDVLQARQQAHLLNLVKDGTLTPMLLLVWAIVVGTLMPIHYRLFKRGVFYNHMRANKKEEQQRFGIFEFCSPSKNPAVKTLQVLSDIVFDSGDCATYLKLLNKRYGSDRDAWPQALSVSLHTSVIVVYSRLWRLCVYVFLSYPWLLAPAYDPTSSEDEVNKCLPSFLRIAKGSQQLDAGFSMKIRDNVETIRDLKEPTLYLFIQTMFMRLVCTSTFVERIFRYLSAWTRTTPQCVATLGAKHTSRMWSDLVAMWRKGLGMGSKDPHRRPAWARSSKGERTTGLHLFSQAQSKSSVFARNADWTALSEEQRAEWKTKAKRRRTVAAAGAPLERYLDDVQTEQPREGPWNLSRQQGPFDIHPDVVRDAYN